MRSRELTRRQLLKGAAGAAGVVALGGGAFGASRALTGPRKLASFAPDVSGVAREFVSRPDLHPPAVTVKDSGTRQPSATAAGHSIAPGYLFLGPSAYHQAQAGPLIMGDDGDPVWFRPISRQLWATNIRRASYRGRPVVSWWEGKMQVIGFGQGEGVLVDGSYHEVARVRAGNGQQMDMHEYMVTPQGTALFTCYPEHVQMDLSAVGGPTDGTVLGGIIQEVDIATGRVLLDWRSLDHIPVSDTYFPVHPWYGFDYLHVNSIDIAPDGHLLLSARHTWALYKIHRTTGEVIWRLGGKSSDFQMGHDAQFSWQHDARHRPDGTISVFDDGYATFSDGAGQEQTESESRGVVLDIDEGGKLVQLVQAYRHPGKGVLSNAMGNFQTLPDGHALIGWGSEPYASEFAADGTLIADFELGNRHDSYRTYRFPWSGRPVEPPALAARRDRHTGKSTLYASWNGATGVAHWLVSTGPHANALGQLGIARRRGFETAIPLHRHDRYAKVTALDKAGNHLASSRVVRL